MDSSPYLLVLSIFIISAFPRETLATCSPCNPSPPVGPGLPLPPLPVIGNPPVTIPPVIGKPPISIPPVPVIGKPPIDIPPVIGKPPITVPPIIGKPPISIPPVPVIGKPPITIPPVIGKPPTTKPCPTPHTPSHPGSCPANTVKLGMCLNVLSVGVHVGDPAAECCPLIEGLAAMDAALCLCTAIKANALGLGVYLPIALQLLVTCGKTVPPGYTCP